MKVDIGVHFILKHIKLRIVEYQHIVCGLKIGTEDYTVHSLVAVDHKGNRYYDHSLTQIEKTKLLDSIEHQAVKGQGFDTTSSTELTTLNVYKGKKLLELLQTNFLKIVDENAYKKENGEYFLLSF